MHVRLSQDLIAQEHFGALMIKEQHTGAVRTLAKAGSGVFTKAQPHDPIKGKCIQRS